jgi:DNA-binding MurR/RpiR family transcriptional regulator
MPKRKGRKGVIDMIGKTYDRINASKRLATNKERKLIEGLECIDPEQLVYMSITELASQLKVAEATVVRFCKKLGYNGFQDFKLSLIKELGTITPCDVNSVIKRIAQQMTDAITETSYGMDYDQCLEIARLLMGAKKIGAFGVGNSAVPAMEIGNVLARVGINVTVTPDLHMQAINTSHMTDKDMVILISVSGSTKDIIDVAEIAKRNGVKIVVITCYDRSPLAKYGDYVLLSTRREAAHEGGSASTIVSISYIINVLYHAICEVLGEEARDYELRTAGAVSNKSI